MRAGASYQSLSVLPNPIWAPRSRHDSTSPPQPASKAKTIPLNPECTSYRGRSDVGGPGGRGSTPPLMPRKMKATGHQRASYLGAHGAERWIWGGQEGDIELVVGGTYDPYTGVVDVYRMVEVAAVARVATREDKDGECAIFVFRVRWRMEVLIPSTSSSLAFGGASHFVRVSRLMRPYLGRPHSFAFDEGVLATSSSRLHIAFDEGGPATPPLIRWCVPPPPLVRVSRSVKVC